MATRFPTGLSNFRIVCLSIFTGRHTTKIKYRPPPFQNPKDHHFKNKVVNIDIISRAPCFRRLFQVFFDRQHATVFSPHPCLHSDGAMSHHFRIGMLACHTRLRLRLKPISAYLQGGSTPGVFLPSLLEFGGRIEKTPFFVVGDTNQGARSLRPVLKLQCFGEPSLHDSDEEALRTQKL
jgi:hypothetical protein